jgi:hypothetical protein
MRVADGDPKQDELDEADESGGDSDDEARKYGEMETRFTPPLDDPVEDKDDSLIDEDCSSCWWCSRKSAALSRTSMLLIVDHERKRKH